MSSHIYIYYFHYFFYSLFKYRWVHMGNIKCLIFFSITSVVFKVKLWGLHACVLFIALGSSSHYATPVFTFGYLPIFFCLFQFVCFLLYFYIFCFQNLFSMMVVFSNSVLFLLSECYADVNAVLKIVASYS